MKIGLVSRRAALFALVELSALPVQTSALERLQLVWIDTIVLGRNFASWLPGQMGF